LLYDKFDSWAWYSHCFSWNAKPTIWYGTQCGKFNSASFLYLILFEVDYRFDCVNKLKKYFIFLSVATLYIEHRGTNNSLKKEKKGNGGEDHPVMSYN
jgi:hypothetical protein